VTGYYPSPWENAGTGGNSYWQPYVQGTDSSWDAWTNAGITITHTANSRTAVEVWDDWTELNRSWQHTTALTTYPVWDEWNRTGATLHSRKWAREGSARKPKPLPELTARQLHDRERQRQIRVRRQEVAALRRRVAQRRAETLLLEHLDAQQREQWAKDRTFTVHTADGRRTYKIREGLAGNVYLVRDGDREAKSGYLRRFCFHAYHPDGSIPNCDNVLAQKLVLEHNEQFFLQEANVG
jgi:hypothetical protein